MFFSFIAICIELLLWTTTNESSRRKRGHEKYQIHLFGAKSTVSNRNILIIFDHLKGFPNCCKIFLHTNSSTFQLIFFIFSITPFYSAIFKCILKTTEKEESEQKSLWQGSNFHTNSGPNSMSMNFSQVHKNARACVVRLKFAWKLMPWFICTYVHVYSM